METTEDSIVELSMETTEDSIVELSIRAWKLSTEDGIGGFSMEGYLR